MMRMLTLGVALLFATSCAALPVSPYAMPETGGVFRYGSFCGPGWPVGQMTSSPQQRIRNLQTIEPVDDIDRMCQFHDLCYARYGDDNQHCDYMLAILLLAENDSVFWMGIRDDTMPRVFHGTLRASQQCDRLAVEIGSVFANHFKPQEIQLHEQFRTQFDRVAGAPDMIFTLISQADSYAIGWPAPGACHMTQAAFDRRREMALQSLARAASSAGSPGSQLTIADFD